MTNYSTRAVRLGAAYAAGQGAANLRRAGHAPAEGMEPEAGGAFQWAEACGFYADEGERGVFCMAFLAALDSSPAGPAALLHAETVGLLAEARVALNWQGAEYLAQRIARTLAKIEGRA